MKSQDVLAAIAAGHAHKAAEHQAGEAAKLGQLRGGAAGIVTPKGAVLGKCPRLAWLRSTGLEPAIDHPETFEMFEGGYANEVIVQDLLERGLPAGLKPVTGDATSLTHHLADGTVWSGRPDIVVQDQAGTPVVGLELKAVCSLWTMLAVRFEGKPKSDHLTQAALYSLHLGKLPWVLLYSCRVEFHVSTAPKFVQDRFEPGDSRLVYKDDGSPLKVLPFNQAYDLRWRADGHVEYSTDGGDWVRTEITETALAKYYALVCAIRDGEDLGPRPSPKSVDGSKSYRACDYCALKPTCDQYESLGKSQWLDHVQVQLTKQP